MKAFNVTYTKKIGGNGNIIVKANSENDAYIRAYQLCATGSDFRNAIEVPMSQYTKPRKQGFAGQR